LYKEKDKKKKNSEKKGATERRESTTKGYYEPGFTGSFLEKKGSGCTLIAGMGERRFTNLKREFKGKRGGV